MSDDRRGVRLRYAGECGVVNEGGCDDESGAVALAESVGIDCDAALEESPAIPWTRLANCGAALSPAEDGLPVLLVAIPPDVAAVARSN